MHIFRICLASLLWLLSPAQAGHGDVQKGPGLSHRGGLHHQHGGNSEGIVPQRKFSPKVVIITMFKGEADTWLGRESLNLFANNVTVPGLSPLFPDVHCGLDEDVCLITTGPGEINAATSLMALAFSPKFDLTRTYFVVTGIGGINPACGSVGSVAFSRYAVQVDLQYEIDVRELTPNYTTGYIPLDSYSANQYPQWLYGTELFELNARLRDRAFAVASSASLAQDEGVAAYRARYPPTDPGSQPPAVFIGDTLTSNIFFSGTLLCDAFANYTRLITNGTGEYCLAGQEDNASFEALVRADLAGRLDFARVILMRVGSDFDRAPPGVSSTQNLLYHQRNGFVSALENVYRAGILVVDDIRANWDSVYSPGIHADNYVGDILNSLHGVRRIAQETRQQAEDELFGTMVVQY